MEHKNKKLPIVIIIVIVIIVIFSLIFLFKDKLISFKSNDNSQSTKINSGELIDRKEEIADNKDKLSEMVGFDVDSKNDENAKYYAEDDNIARIEYDLNGMHLVLKISTDGGKDLVNMYHEWSTGILMTTSCKDGTSIIVSSNTAIDDSSVMRSEWKDNNKFYSLTTQNLSTREEFLQEVNRYIIENHKEQ